MNFTQLKKQSESVQGKQGPSTQAQRNDYIKLWETSGQTRKEFCETHHLKTKTFSKWVRQARLTSKTMEVNASNKNLTETDNKWLTTKTTQSEMVEINLPNAIQIKSTLSSSSRQLLELIKELSQCSFN